MEDFRIKIVHNVHFGERIAFQPVENENLKINKLNCSLYRLYFLRNNRINPKVAATWPIQKINIHLIISTLLFARSSLLANLLSI